MIGPLNMVKTIRLVRWVLTGIAIWTITWVVLLIVDRPILGPRFAAGSVKDLAVIQSGLRPKGPEQQEVNYAAIMQSDPFGNVTMERPAEAQQVQYDLPMAQRLGLELVGTITGDPSVARAIIKEKGTKTSKVYRIGQQINGARIEAIERDAVSLNVNGNIERIGRSVQPVTLGPLKQRDDLNVDATSRSNVGYTATLSHLLQKAKISLATLPDGRCGLRMAGLDEVPAIRTFGIEDGDIIQAINGQELNSLQKAFQVLRKARSAGTIEVEMIRDGQTKRFLLPLK